MRPLKRAGRYVYTATFFTVHQSGTLYRTSVVTMADQLYSVDPVSGVQCTDELLRWCDAIQQNESIIKCND